MSFITRNVNNLVEDKSRFKEVKRLFYKLSGKRYAINPEYMAAVIINNGPEEYRKVVDKVMALYKNKEITRAEAQARLWGFVVEVKREFDK